MGSALKASGAVIHNTNTSLASRASVRAIWRQYYYLTKPGIVRGNLFTAVAGFLLAAAGSVAFTPLISLIIGLAMVIGSGCVFNNYLDRNIDIRMARTSRRALVTGVISVRHALLFGALLGSAGLAILAGGAGVLAAALAAAGLFAYVVVYGIAKRQTVHGTLIGSISGAIPPLVGYAAGGGSLDLGALLLFVVLVTWQMPHFYAIALYRHEDYKAAGLPILAVVRGFRTTTAQIIMYTALYGIAVSALTITGAASAGFGIAMTILNSVWLLQTLQGLRIGTDDDAKHWARRVFRSSLLVLTLLCIAIAVDSFI